MPVMLIFGFLPPAAPSAVREAARVKNEKSHLTEMWCHCVIFKLTAQRKKKGLSFSPPTVALTEKDIHPCLNAGGRKKCKSALPALRKYKLI